MAAVSDALKVAIIVAGLTAPAWLALFAVLSR